MLQLFICKINTQLIKTCKERKIQTRKDNKKDNKGGGSDQEGSSGERTREQQQSKDARRLFGQYNDQNITKDTKIMTYRLK